MPLAFDTNSNSAEPRKIIKTGYYFGLYGKLQNLKIRNLFLISLHFGCGMSCPHSNQFLKNFKTLCSAEWNQIFVNVPHISTQFALFFRWSNMHSKTHPFVHRHTSTHAYAHINTHTQRSAMKTVPYMDQTYIIKKFLSTGSITIC